MIETPPIIVTGVPRSGTSMVCGVLNQLGAFGGDMRGPNRHNPRGMFENKKIVKVTKDWLEAKGYDKMAQHPLPDPMTCPSWPELRGEIEGSIVDDGYKGGPWFFKTVKGCHMWPLFDRAFPNAKWVIVYRDVDANARSLLRTPFMRAYKDLEGWHQYIQRHHRRFEEIYKNVKEAHIVHSDFLPDGYYGQLKNVVSKLDLEWDEGKVNSFIEPRLWNS